MKPVNREEIKDISLNSEELSQYARHLALPGFGLEGQLKLKQAKVLVVGAGGLGSPLLLYLTAAGVGSIGIVDFDTVDSSNLQRQILYTQDDVGKPKAEVAKEKLTKLNPNVRLEVYNGPFSIENALELVALYDIIADGTDNFGTRYLINDACVLAGKINVYASIFRFEGQVSVFNYPYPDGSFGPNYRDLHPTPPLPGAVPNCAESGVLGVLPGLVGCMQANEVIKLITGIGTPLVAKLLLIDALSLQLQTLQLPLKTKTNIKELKDTAVSCDTPVVKEISVQEVMELSEQSADFQLIDVREASERAAFNIGGISIPLSQIAKADVLKEEEKMIIFYCQSGIRSAQAIELLQAAGLVNNNFYNLKGGIKTWLQEISTKK